MPQQNIKKSEVECGLTIVQVAPFVPVYPNIGGLETYIALITKKMAKRGHNVIIIGGTYESASNALAYKVNGCRCIAVRRRLGSCYHSFFGRFHKRVYHILSICLNVIIFTPRLLQVLLRSKPDVIIFYGFYYAPLAIFTRMLCRKVLLGQFTFQPQWGPLLPSIEYFKVTNLFWFVTLRCFNGIITTTAMLWTRGGKVIDNMGMLSYFRGQNKVHLIPAGIDSSEFINIRPDLRLKGLKQQGYVLVMCPRRLVPEKGVQYLVEAIPITLKRFNRVVFLFTGDGPLLNSLRNRVHQLHIKDHVIFTGKIPRLDVLSCLRAADVIVIPSSSEENFGMAILEAYAFGKVVVGTKLGGIPTVIEGGETGLLVDPCNPVQLADAITIVLTRPKLRQKLSNNAHEMLETRFDILKIVDRLLQVYSS